MSNKTIFIAGGSGFVGSAIIDELLTSGYTVRALVRSVNKSRLPADVELIEGDPFNPDSYRAAMTGCSAVINAIGIIREKKKRGITFERIHSELNRTLLQTAQESDVGHFLLISALGARPDGISRYQTSKAAAEEDLKTSGLTWTIFKPSFVIGPGTGFVSQIAPIVKAPITPVFGAGDSRFEPVDRRVLAQAVVASIDNPKANNVTFEFRGERNYSYVEILDLIGAAIGKKKVRKLHLPLWLVKPLIKTFGWLPFSPISYDQLNMLLEGGTGSGPNACQILGIEWIDLPEALNHTFK